MASNHPILTAIYCTETSGTRLTARWTIGEHCDAYRHAKRSV